MEIQYVTIVERITMTEPIKRSELYKLEYENMVTRSHADMNTFIGMGHTSEECSKYGDELLKKEKIAEMKWIRQEIIEYIEENNLPMSYLDKLPKSLGGNKE